MSNARGSSDALRHASTAEAIVEHLMDRIQRWELRAGDRLPSERLLQAELGVGRLALREGLARLSALGVIRVEHGKAAVVAERGDSGGAREALASSRPDRDAKTLKDLAEARALIEGELAARAAIRRSEDDIKRLRAMLDSPGAALEDGQELAEMDLSFLQEIARIAGNEFLSAMLAALAAHIRAFIEDYARATGDQRSVIERRRPLLEAIAERNPERARECARKHIDACKSSLDACGARRRGEQW